MQALPQGKRWLSRREFLPDLNRHLKTAGVSLGAPRLKALVGILGEHDDNAEVCTDAKGRLECSPDLRDTENVPLSEDIQVYFEREV